MDRRTPTRRHRILAVPLIALVVMCFVCALCHSTGTAAQPASAAAAADCPEQTRGSASEAPAAQAAHPCEAAEGHGLPTAPPLFLLALGALLVCALLSAPRPGPAARPADRTPHAPHGYGLLTLLCVQRV
ncbi:hypothetical protein ACIRPH_10455 [Nocardiopsis sp. NPDC101807]|uniref:hypothetical protein n=1 Tax=Nocardiopsis sp. NPDC101807 TaxID=3364339 RepID=UPI00381D0A7E